MRRGEEYGDDRDGVDEFEALIAASVHEEKAESEDPAPPSASTASFSSGNRAGRWGMWAAIGVIVGGLGLLGIAAYALLNQQQASPEAAPAEQSAPELTLIEPDEGDTGEETAGEGITALVDPSWADPLADELGIPHRAMRAYTGAVICILTEQPECGLGWNTLAGIGHVESEHGTIDGSRITPEGIAEPAIRGIPLDGTTTDRIPDTDNGALDGDTEWDRAVGPMQFIPSTWKQWGADGSGDGEVDPQHIDDAAYSAARYLCASGGDLRQPENWIAAVAAYNDTVEYNNRVAEAADHYAALAAQHR